MDRQRAEDRTRRREAQSRFAAQTPPPATPSPKRPRQEQAPHSAADAAKALPKRPRPMRETVQLQRDSVESILHHYNATFRVKEQASSTRSWCNEVPVALQVEAAKSFYQAFTEERTLPVSHCVFCYRKTPPCELATIQWRDRLSPSMLQATKTVQECGACLPSHEGARVDVCRECRAGFDSGRLPKACSVNNMAIGCEHRYPEELDDLSPVEERLIALHAPFGYITKFTVDNKTRSGISYRKHVKGHIVVFPNKVDDLVATVLPHPLLQAIENIHVSWSGPGKPGSADVRHLLQVRKSRVAAALAWLQRNNPLYEDIAINQAEIDGWQYADGSTVPTVIMDRMRREEPSTVEKTQTDHIVPDTDRGLENSFRSIDELIVLCPRADSTIPGEPATLVPDSAAIGLEVDAVCEMSASGMFPLNGPAAFAETDKLSFLADIVNANPDRHGNSVPLEQAYANLNEDRLKRAEAEMREARTTSDPDISVLLRELSIFGHAQPLSNESRLLMRRKIQAVNIWAGMPAVWITISPNDINNPIKMKLAIHRLHDYDSAMELLADLRERYDRIALSTMDPVSSAIFFHREISLFFDKYVNTGQESIFGKISHYYATVETNERGSLHLHGLLWLDGNMRLPNLVDDMANPAEEGYRAQVTRYVDSVFHECLDEDAGKTLRQQRKPIHPVEEVMTSTSALTAAFEDESNFIAYCCQVHSHTYTCLKYSLKGIVEQGADPQRRTACRFKAPWKIVDETGFTEDGLLQIRRNHPLVNRYNKSLAVGLRHNHDVSMILTKTKGLAMVYYITNYATKLDTPMWKRIALAAEVARQLREAGRPTSRAPDPTLPDDRQQAVLNESRQFLMRTANRIFSERQLSAVEVCYHLLGYDTDFTNVPHWSFLNLTALYWAIFRLWAHLRHQAGELTDAEQPPETIRLRQGGRTLLYLDAYAYRGHVLRDLCLYDYMSMIHLMRRKSRSEDDSHFLDGQDSDCDGWMQKLRRPDQYAVPIFQGYISDDHEDDHPVYIKRNSVLHLALFVPWENFVSESQGDITDIWTRHRAGLCPRLRFHVSNICLLRKSAEDARKDTKLWASRSEVTTQLTLRLLVLLDLIRDVRKGNLAGGQPFVQRQEDLYLNIPHDQGDTLCQFPILSRDDVQAAAKAQDLLHLRMLDDIEGGSQGTVLSTNGADIDDTLARYGDMDTAAALTGSDLNEQGPRMLVDVTPATSFAEMGHTTAATFTLNYLQTMALQLVCAFLDRYTANPDSAGQHLQYTGGPGGTGKSRIIDALKDVFAARNQPHLLQITGTSGSSAAQIGGTTIHSACGLWHLFKTVVLLEDQVRARDDPQLGALLDRVRDGRQTRQDLDLLNANIVGRSQITFDNGLRAITPLNRTRWALNMEAVVGWARFNKQHIRIFISTHTWRNGTLSPNIIAQTIGQGDDSVCKVPGVFSTPKVCRWL
ncbi:ATP-dependent DNA helicase PIF1 [Hirsutella rhossiliensis]|uniref:ATP-dependent DNA helicase PIF1 n=2 Tax=Hirsutella rhossiliensis TaxID=111463 RepID=A0A9P8MYM1_9HYPO|nr:ATP-dependent DNA helicase PIF1 [Hirsutella rhossiliensis]KAH0963624.1 ATP-dependent DNA helicase PIF1 [Hirsutella rhossiliensis]